VRALLVVLALAGLGALGCGRYGPPRRPEPATPLVVVTPAAAQPTEPAAPTGDPSQEQCEAPSP
jgi:hypothetical protein